MQGKGPECRHGMNLPPRDQDLPVGCEEIIAEKARRDSRRWRLDTAGRSIVRFKSGKAFLDTVPCSGFEQHTPHAACMRQVSFTEARSMHPCWAHVSFRPAFIIYEFQKLFKASMPLVCVWRESERLIRSVKGHREDGDRHLYLHYIPLERTDYRKAARRIGEQQGCSSSEVWCRRSRRILHP